MDIKRKYKIVFDYLDSIIPFAETELVYKNPYQLTVSVILSAQCTDKRVNEITPTFFNRFPSINELAKANVKEIYKYIKSCSYPNNKAKLLKNMAITLQKNYNNIIPEDIEELMKIPGIGRKSANVLASILYKKPVIAVDTHVFRVSKRIGLTPDAKTPLTCEKILMQNISPEILPKAHHLLILFGRYICMARKPKCTECQLTRICDYYNQIIIKK